MEHLDSLPKTEELMQQMQKLAEQHFPVPKHFLSGRVFRHRQDATHKQGVIEMSKDGMADTWKLVFDLDEAGRREGKSFEFANYGLPSNVIEGTSCRILIMLSEGGSDLAEVREVDVDTGDEVPGGFRTPAGRSTLSWLDMDHVLITHALNNGPTTGAGWPTNTYIWTRGTDLTEAKLVHSVPTTHAIAVNFAMGSGPNRLGLIHECPDYSTNFYHLVSVDGRIRKLPLPSKINLPTSLTATSKHLVVSLTEPATVAGKDVPAGTLVACDVTRKENSVSIVHIPNEGEFNTNIFIHGLAASISRVYQTLSSRGLHRLVVSEFREDNTWSVVRTVCAAPGCVIKVEGADRSSNRVIIVETGLLTPTQIIMEDEAWNRTILHSEHAAFDGSGYVVETQSAQSRDGTSVDYIMLAPKVRKEPLPILMTGYGGFGISFPLDYVNASLGGLSLVPWLEAGGALVVGLVRGGGERGVEWHHAGMREKRQNAYDDFIGVAEALIQRGLTTPEHLGVFGGSNGGLLAGVMGTQRPDLFNAIVSDVPMADMMRYPYMGMGSAWLEEYGNPEDPEIAVALLAYSPFHNIKTGIKYPPFLVTSSTMDDRVGAGHGRKLAARLQEVGATAFLYEQTEGGHGVSDAFKHTAFMARRTAFLMSQLL